MKVIYYLLKSSPEDLADWNALRSCLGEVVFIFWVGSSSFFRWGHLPLSSDVKNKHTKDEFIGSKNDKQQ